MNILYIADPNSIHDIRWINSLSRDSEVKGFIIARSAHYKSFDPPVGEWHESVSLVASIEDPSIVRPWRNWQQVLKIRKIVQRYNIELLHILYAEPNSLWANWKWFLKVPIVLTTRGTDILKTIPLFFNRKSFFSKMIASRYANAFNHTDHIFATSLSQIENLRLFNSRCPSSLVRTGVELSSIQKSGNAGMKNVNVATPFILMPRNMKPIYCHEFTINAIALLPENIKRQYSFVFVNSDTKEKSYFESIRRQAESIDANILFLPSLRHEEYLGLCKQSTLVVMNPMSDGSPVTAMEAMACKIPVILPPLNYDQDLFRSAYFFEDWSPVALKDKIEYVLGLSIEELSSNIERSFQNVLQHGNAEVEMRKVKDIYEELVKNEVCR